MKVLQDEHYASSTQASRAITINRFWKKNGLHPKFRGWL